MRDKRDNHSPKWWERVFAPLMTLKIEKFYWFCVLSFVISFAGIVVDLLNGDFEASANNGIVYSTCIAIIAPLFIEFLANYISVNHQKKKEELLYAKSTENTDNLSEIYHRHKLCALNIEGCD